MNRSSLNDFFSLRRKTRQRPRALAFEPLEERRLLTADLIASTFDSTNGYSVIRYNSTTQMITYGAATGDQGLSYASGLAVAPDGSYYVSSLGSGQVLHFSGAGVFMNVLGGNDANPAPLAVPGALAFGPNGNLYVADLGGTFSGYTFPGAIYQFNVNSTTQQYQAADTISLPANFSPGGFTFAPDATHDLIVGNISTQESPYFQAVVEIGPDGTYSPLVPANSGIYAGSVLPLSNGNFLIADFDADYNPAAHHQIVEYSPPTGTETTGTLTQLIDFANYPQYDDSYGDPAQPISMTTDTDGNVLMGISPAEGEGGLYGAVVKYDFSSGDLTTVVSSIGSPSGLAYAPLEIPAADWTSAGLTITETSDGMLHVYTTGTTTPDVITPVAAASVSGIQFTGLTTSSYTLTIDTSGGNPIPFAGDAFVNGDSCSYAVQSGSVGPNLTGAGSLTKTGSGTATLSGMNTYQGGTVVTGGKLVVTSATGVPDGSNLMVGVNVATYFGSARPAAASAMQEAVEASPVAASTTPSNDISNRGASKEASTAPFSTKTPDAVTAPLSGPAHDTVMKGYNGSNRLAVVRPSAAGLAAWWNSTGVGSGSQDTLAVNHWAAPLDALMAEYGAA
jgi:autotransporter-associated beta strand protein